MAEYEQSRALQSAYREYERGIRIYNYRVACILAFVFMPAGALLDYFVLRDTYPHLLGHFFKLRLLCSGLLLFIWWLVKTPLGLRIHGAFGQVVAALPSFFISLMIWETDGAFSPYYAGINLVLLGAGLVLRWRLLDSILVVLTALLMYITACVFCPVPFIDAWKDGIFFNNLYFLAVTGVFVVIGSFYYDRIRFREFGLRYELDQNRRELEESNQKLLELDQLKSRFFANISHELRTPLTLLLAPLEGLLSRPDVQPEVRDLLTTMHGNGLRLLKLINDLLDLVRLESGRMQVKSEPVAVESFVTGLASTARQVAEDKRLQLSTRMDPALGTVLTDPDKLEKIILNLTFNALKFTPPGGKVEIAAEKKEDAIVLTVSDTGMGISEKNLPHIFDRFWQGDDSSNRKYQGVGIGLSLVKEFVTVQGGTISVKSTEGKGTSFTVNLPCKTAPPQGVAAQQTRSEESETTKESQDNADEWLTGLYRRAELFPALSPVKASIRPVEADGRGRLPTLLIADDEPDMLRFLQSQLSSEYHVVMAVDGQQAIEKATHFLPNIILLDMMMPEKDGLQACREIRDLTPTQNIPIVLLTARADEETKMAALQAGASDFLAKPFSTAELQARIRNLVERHSFQRQLARQNQALEAANDQLKGTINQLKETELQLIQTEKLASLGRMSAGIIHEMNNPLNFVNTGLMVLKKKSAFFSGDQQADYLDVLKDVSDGVERMKSIITDLRTFTVDNSQHREPVNLAEVTGFALRFVSHEWKHRIAIQENIPKDLIVIANTNLMVQVLVNIIKNAIDAINARNFEDGEEPTIWIEAERKEEIARLKVRDNGIGIQDKDLGRIFDPFFSTKDQGQGMGLGLSLCYRIIQSFEGKISVRTQPGKFAEFLVELPAETLKTASNEPSIRL